MHDSGLLQGIRCTEIQACGSVVYCHGQIRVDGEGCVGEDVSIDIHWIFDDENSGAYPGGDVTSISCGGRFNKIRIDE